MTTNSTEPARSGEIYSFADFHRAVADAYDRSEIPLPVPGADYGPHVDAAGTLRFKPGCAADVEAWTWVMDDVTEVKLTPIRGLVVEVRAVGLLGGVPVAVIAMDNTVPEDLTEQRQVSVGYLKEFAFPQAPITAEAGVPA